MSTICVDMFPKNLLKDINETNTCDASVLIFWMVNLALAKNRGCKRLLLTDGSKTELLFTSFSK